RRAPACHRQWLVAGRRRSSVSLLCWPSIPHPLSPLAGGKGGTTAGEWWANVGFFSTGIEVTGSGVQRADKRGGFADHDRGGFGLEAGAADFVAAVRELVGGGDVADRGVGVTAKQEMLHPRPLLDAVTDLDEELAGQHRHGALCRDAERLQLDPLRVAGLRRVAL